MSADDKRIEPVLRDPGPRLADIVSETPVRADPPLETLALAAPAASPAPAAAPAASAPAASPSALAAPAAATPPAEPAPAPPAAVRLGDPEPRSLRLVLRRTIKSGLIGGKKFELTARAESEKDLAGLFKGYSDELLLAYKSAFVDKSTAVRRSELLRGVRFTVGSLNEMIELEDRLQIGFDQLKRMVAIVESGGQDVVFDG